MLKRNELTREDIVNLLRSNIILAEDNEVYEERMTKDGIKWHNNILRHLIDDLGDDHLAYNTNTGFFEYVGAPK
jgi:hypothetical protein